MQWFIVTAISKSIFTQDETERHSTDALNRMCNFVPAIISLWRQINWKHDRVDLWISSDKVPVGFKPNPVVSFANEYVFL